MYSYPQPLPTTATGELIFFYTYIIHPNGNLTYLVSSTNDIFYFFFFKLRQYTHNIIYYVVAAAW